MLQANSWKQSGAVWVWRYTENLRNFPGWHLTADTTGCRSLLTLLDAFAADGIAGTRTINVSAPTASVLGVPNNRAAAWLAPTKFRLSISPTPSQWSFPDSLEPAELAIGADWLPQLRQVLPAFLLGKGTIPLARLVVAVCGSGSGGSQPLPNNSFKPNPLRGSA